MKKIIGIVITLLSIALIGIIILRIWNIEIVSFDNMIRSSATLILIGLAIVILSIIYSTFLRNNKQAYNQKKVTKRILNSNIEIKYGEEY